LLAAAGATAIELSDSHWTLHEGELAPSDAWFEHVVRAMGETDILARQDMSFEAFINGHLAASLSPEERQFALTMAEGFDAADTAVASARAIAEEWRGDTLGEAPQARPQHGYESLLNGLAAALTSERLHLRLQAPVDEIRWSRDAVFVSGRSLGETFEAHGRRAIVTLPVGVLQRPAEAGGLQFTPPLHMKRHALGGLAFGAILKVVLRFATPFWETVQEGRYREASFFHMPGAQIPTYWTASPLQAPLLVAWAGGPRAQRLAEGGSEIEIVRTAIAGVERLFGATTDVAAQFQAYYYHDWQLDPLTRGAYSYARVGGTRAPAQLAQPLEDTLFFAGEATDTDGELGTVTGALQSGCRAAREVLNCSS
jgi:monoamine oxidase